MATVGMKNIMYGLLDSAGDGTTYAAPKVMAKAISCTVSLDMPEASLYADDSLAEYQTAFTKATINLNVDDDDDTVFAEILGKTIDSTKKTVTSNIGDNAPYVGFGYIVSRIKNNIKSYRAQFFPKVKFKPFIPDANTKGESIEFGTPNVEGVSSSNINGVWEVHQEATTEADAITALNAFFVQSTPTPS